MIYQLEADSAACDVERPRRHVPSSALALDIRSDNRKLSKGELLSIDLQNDQFLRVNIHEGEVWLTIEGDRNDYVLHAGEERVVSGEGRVVLEGLEQSVISLS